MTQQEILRILLQFREEQKERYKISRIGIFGSAARNQHTENSDIDVVVQLTEPDIMALIGIKLDLEQLFQRPVDIVRYRQRMSSFLKQRIDQEALYV
jgi:predicted nucleotidyltransferase